MFCTYDSEFMWRFLTLRTNSRCLQLKFITIALRAIRKIRKPKDLMKSICSSLLLENSMRASRRIPVNGL